MANIDFSEIAFLVSKSLKCRTKEIRAETGSTSLTYEKYYKQYHFKKIFIAGSILFPIAGIKFKPVMKFSQGITNYTKEGRELLHTKLNLDENILLYLMRNPVKNRSTEYNDNRISLYAGQQGKCYVTGEPLEIGSMEVHHQKPVSQGGTDKYNNLRFVTTVIHKLIHAVNIETIMKYLDKQNLNSAQLEKLNKLRVSVGNNVIASKI